MANKQEVATENQEGTSVSGEDFGQQSLVSDALDFSSDKDGTRRQFIIFSIGTEEYAAPILAVREIKGWIPTTKIPNAPEYMRGVINLRGSVVPILDLRARFGGGLTETTERHVVIIVLVGERTIGILADAISDILTVSEDRIQPTPDMDLSVDANCLDGLVAEGDRMVALLNIENLIGKDDLKGVEDVETE